MADSIPTTQPHPTQTWLRLIADTLPAYVAYIDDRLRYRMVNRRYEEQFGLVAEQIIGLPVAEVLGDSFANVRARLESALAGQPQRFETRMQTLDGDRVLLVTHLPDRDEQQRVRGIIVHGVDVTERHLAEEALRRSEDRFRLLIERAGIGIHIGNERGDLSYMNPALLEILGYTLEEAQNGRLLWESLTPPASGEKTRLALEQLKVSGRAEPYEAVYRANDGRLVPLLLSTTLIPSLAQEDTGDIAVFFTDLSRQKKAEAVLLQTEKLAAVGKLAASISHELNNPLEAVTNLLFLVRQDPSLSPETREYLEVADRELSRMAQVTSQTLRFHRQSTRPQQIAADALTEEVLILYRPRLENSGIAVQRKYAESVLLTCYESDVRQVLNNLVGNAIDAVRAPGRLLIRTRNATRWSSGTAGVRITIADNGCGMPPEVLARIFEAFYTTKGINGTGLGLWISHRIVHKHRGLLRARSIGGEGSVFSLWLPKNLAASAQQSWMAAELDILR